MKNPFQSLPAFLFPSPLLSLLPFPFRPQHDMRRAIALTLTAFFLTAPAAAQNYPTRTLRMIVPNAAGSAPDIIARMIGQKLTEAWGQQVVRDSRAGAGGMIGTELAARAAADGYTLLMVTATVIN